MGMIRRVFSREIIVVMGAAMLLIVFAVMQFEKSGKGKLRRFRTMLLIMRKQLVQLAEFRLDGSRDQGSKQVEQQNEYAGSTIHACKNRNISIFEQIKTPMKKIIRPLLYALLAAVLVIQFFQIDKTNPAADPAQDFLAVANPPAEVTSLLKAACYDCHSSHTTYPWYTYIQPVGWWVKDHVQEGKEHLDFSIWATYPAKRAAHKLEECFEMIENKEMPLKSYTWMHGNARLSAEQRTAMAAWFRAEYARMETGE